MDRRSVLLATLAAPLLHGQDAGFTGTPLVRVDSDEKETKRIELSDAAGEKYQCRIVRKGRKYLWANRNDRELKRAEAGDWTYYVSPEGSGYVKVFQGAAEMPFDYMEHVTSELKTVTYWGKRA